MGPSYGFALSGNFCGPINLFLICRTGFLVIFQYNKNQEYDIGSLFHDHTTYWLTKRYVEPYIPTQMRHMVLFKLLHLLKLNWLFSVDWEKAGQNQTAGGRDALLHVRCPASG